MLTHYTLHIIIYLSLDSVKKTKRRENVNTSDDCQ